MLKLSGFGDEITPDFEGQLIEMRKMGLNHIALRNLWNTNILDLNANQKKEARYQLRKYGMGVSEIGSPLGKVLITSTWKKEWERYERAIELAHFFNCPRIRIFSFYFPKGKAPEMYRDKVIDRLKQMTDRAEQEGLILLHENESNIYRENGYQCRDLAATIDSPHFRLIFDPANFVFSGTHATSQWFDIMADYVTHIHVKDVNFNKVFFPAGEGESEIPLLIEKLVQRGFTGYATMEPHLAHGGQFSGFSGPENFANATEAFRRVCDKAGMPHREVRMGTIGMGFIGMFHCTAMKSVPEAHLVAVADVVDSPNFEKAQEQFNCEVYNQIDELLNRPDIDAITIGTPSGLHGEITIKAAQQKKHVLTEKPIEVTLDKCDAMIEACRAQGVKLGVISQHRWDPGMMELKDAIESGTLGDLILGEAYIKWFRSQQYYDSGGWRGTWKLDGGGALMNQGIHTVDMLQWVMGEVESVTAQTATLAHERIEVEDIAQALLKFKNGALGTIIGSTAIYPGMSERVEVSGTKGTIVVDKDKVVLREIMGEKKSKEASESEDRGTGAADPQAISNHGHVSQIRDFIYAILEDRDPLIPGEEGRKPLEIILAVYEAARKGVPVTLPLTEYTVPESMPQPELKSQPKAQAKAKCKTRRKN
ncbi:MAG: Gfo/Idh/MocA family oxidoreductase [bacterium]|jgi:predicted dehydrogenase/sugar phosphate isomerase/epimerase|nr:Gfo/Idh/MocA family oxidoreductase [bacterium]